MPVKSKRSQESPSNNKNSVKPKSKSTRCKMADSGTLSQHGPSQSTQNEQCVQFQASPVYNVSQSLTPATQYSGSNQYMTFSSTTPFSQHYGVHTAPSFNQQNTDVFTAIMQRLDSMDRKQTQIESINIKGQLENI